jgi:inward rectifier potassium channel
LIFAVFLLVNAMFAVGFRFAGGIVNARPGSFVDAFYFSVQTMGTVGYGAMYPNSTAANLLVVLEVMVGITLTAFATGLVFAKFSRPTARVVFTRNVVLSPMDGVPTLTFRVGNERGNSIVDARFRVALSRTEHPVEGGVFYRTYDLKLVRDRALSLNRSFSLRHVVEEGSPFFGQTPESILADEFELQVMVIGLDDTAMQTVHATHLYFARDILWGSRLVDILTEAPDGAMLLDLRKFHDVETGKPIAAFPYPARSNG